MPAALACSTRAGRGLPRLDERTLGPEPSVVEVRFGRLEEPVRQVVVRHALEVGPIVDEDGARSWDVEPVDEGAEPVLVDELLDRVARRQAGREALS